MKVTHSISKWDHHCVIDGKSYVRFGPTEWLEWRQSMDAVGLELADHHVELEAAFQEWSKSLAFRKPRDPKTVDAETKENQ